MDLGLRGRVALVCAASAGLGKATAVAFAREGAHVVLCARDVKRLKAAAAEVRRAGDGLADVVAVKADLSRPRDIQRFVASAVKSFGRIDILVTNAGGPPVGAFPDLSDAAWHEGHTLTLMSAVRCIRAVLPHMRARRWGRIVAITSVAAKQPLTDLVMSSAIRPGILGLAKVLSNQYAGEGILVNCVAPGYHVTARQEEIGRARASKKGITLDQYFQEMTRDVPLQRVGRPEECADAVVFLASERASYISGVTLAVDGGLTKGLL
jgi:3-oxoacyl-[acyl-carrier protein] reductase